MRFCPNSAYILTGGADKILRWIDVRKKCLAFEWEGSEMQIMTVGISPDLKYIAAAGFD